MDALGNIKTDTHNIIEVKTKIPSNTLVKKEVEPKIKVNYSDTLKSTELKSSKNEIKPISIDSELSKSVQEGIKIKGALFGLEYLGAGTALGMGYNSKFLNIVPQIAKNTPTILGVTNKYPKIAVVALSAGAVGVAMGSLKGSADGVMVNYAPSKGVAMGATGITSALIATPLLKVSKPIGFLAIGAGATLGSLYGSYIYDKVKNK